MKANDNTIKIGGYRFKIEHITPSDNLAGEIDFMDYTIRISSNCMGKELDNQKREGTLIHEILHGVDEVYNNNALSEEMIDRLGEGLYQVLKDNFNIDFGKYLEPKKNKSLDNKKKP